MRLLIFLLFISTSVLAQNRSELQGDVIVTTVGKSSLFVFPSSQGRIKVQATRIGEIRAGSNIVVLYAIHVSQGNARFIAFDASKAKPGFTPRLTGKPGQSNEVGFIVKDSTVIPLHIHIDPGFLKAKEQGMDIKEKIAHEANAEIIIREFKGHDGGIHYQIEKVVID